MSPWLLGHELLPGTHLVTRKLLLLECSRSPRAWIFLPYRRSRSSLIRLSIMATSMLRLFKSSFCCWSLEFCS